MFKKTLLALSVAATASFGANAGQLGESANVATAAALAATDAVSTAIGAAAIAGCQDMADQLGVTLDLNGKVHNAAGVNDVIAAAATVTVTPGAGGTPLVTTDSVVLTGTDGCDVFTGSTLDAASDTQYSLEGAEADGVTIGATYVAGIGGLKQEDTIILTVSGGTINETDSAGAELNTGVGEFTLLGVVGNTIQFTVDVDQAPLSIVNLSGLVIDPAADTTSITVSSIVQNTAAIQYDVVADTEVVSITNQYSSRIHNALDGVVDVQTERLTLAIDANDNFNSLDTGANELVNTDSLFIETTLETTPGNLTPQDNVFTITGSFGWMMDLDADEDGELSSAEINNGVTYQAYATEDTNADGTNFEAGDNGDDDIDTWALNEEMTELTATGTAVGGVVDLFHSFMFVVPGDEDGTTALNVQDFTVGFTTSDADEEDMVVTAASTVAGEWTLNGSVVNVPYMPFGGSTQPILRHTNVGSQTGDISVRYMLETDGADENPEWVSLGVVVEDAQPGMVNLLDPAVNAAITDSGLTSGKMALEITTNVPADDVTVFAGAKITTSDSDRLSIGAF